MVLLELLLDKASSNPIAAVFAIVSTFLLSRCLYRLTFHPLAHIPGPLLPKATSLWLYYHAYIGDEASVIHKAHEEFGPFVRVSPHEVDISDGDAIQAIYVTKGGFQKAPWYAARESAVKLYDIHLLTGGMNIATAILILTGIRLYFQHSMLIIEPLGPKPWYLCSPPKISETMRLHCTNAWIDWWKG